MSRANFLRTIQQLDPAADVKPVTEATSDAGTADETMAETAAERRRRLAALGLLDNGRGDSDGEEEDDDSARPQSANLHGRLDVLPASSSAVDNDEDMSLRPPPIPTHRERSTSTGKRVRFDV